jgi:uncharacterized membrane protein YphA (DoxX/SURF4 family)
MDVPAALAVGIFLNRSDSWRSNGVHRNRFALQDLTLSDVDGVLDLAAGLVLLLSLFSHSLAFLLSGEMASAYFIRHAPSDFFSVHNVGDLEVILCLVFLLVAALGFGEMSLDALLVNRRACVRIMNK